MTWERAFLWVALLLLIVGYITNAIDFLFRWYTAKDEKLFDGVYLRI